ncbi:MAG: HmuY family protein [Acidimicrobiia bacterium]
MTACTTRLDAAWEAIRMRSEMTSRKRWWRLKRTWLIGIPSLLAIGVVGTFVWGGLQPRPAGFAPVDEPQIVAAPQKVNPVVDEAAFEPMEITRYTVDAKSRDDWVLFDFNEGRVIEGDLSSPGWDLAFRRTTLLTNSGETNPSGAGGAIDLGEVLLEDAVTPESVVFDLDVLGGEDEDELENPAIGGWYSYSFIKHIISTRQNTYLVGTGEDLNALVQFDSYYCEDEEPGCITFRYRLVPQSITAGS